MFRFHIGLRLSSSTRRAVTLLKSNSSRVRSNNSDLSLIILDNSFLPDTNRVQFKFRMLNLPFSPLRVCSSRCNRLSTFRTSSQCKPSIINLRPKRFNNNNFINKYLSS